jgi:hypothetical protein
MLSRLGEELRNAAIFHGQRQTYILVGLVTPSQVRAFPTNLSIHLRSTPVYQVAQILHAHAHHL